MPRSMPPIATVDRPSARAWPNRASGARTAREVLEAGGEVLGDLVLGVAVHLLAAARKQLFAGGEVPGADFSGGLGGEERGAVAAL